MKSGERLGRHDDNFVRLGFPRPFGHCISSMVRVRKQEEDDEDALTFAAVARGHMIVWLFPQDMRAYNNFAVITQREEVMRNEIIAYRQRQARQL
jgi:hypothetical protein